MTKKFSGSGGIFGGGEPTETDDNLFSTDIVEVVLGVSEGPIYGLSDGPKSFLLAETPLKNVNDENNFDSFELVVRKGSDLGEKIVSRMGGFASSTTVSTELASSVPVVRQATHTGIDYLDIRLVINRLLRQNDDGSFNHTGKVKIEYKKTNDATWLPVSTAVVTPPPQQVSSTYTDVYTELQPVDKVSASPGDRTTYWQAEEPPFIAGSEKAIWFDSDDNNKPYGVNDSWWSGTEWQVMPSAAFASGSWTWSEPSSWGGDRQTRMTAGNEPPTIVEQGDYWVNTEQNRVYFFNGSAWIVAGTSLAPGGFGGEGIVVSDGEVSITGKTSTSFVKEFRFPIDNIEDDTYQIRITKTSPNNTSEDFFDVTWESFQEVTAAPMQFPGLATVQLTARASEQFSSIPQFSGIYKGRIVRVPSNYDPVNKIYTGLWDGTWILAYSNNPAYIVNDLVSNDRYGLNAYYPVVLDKWDVYEAGVWCDTRTVNGTPRFTFNQLIDAARSCREAIDYICGIFGGRFFDDGNGSANIRIDKPETSSGIFTVENVVDGIFSYSFTDATTRYNDITVTFKNPALAYKEDRLRVFNAEHIAQYGRIPLNFIAVGCNSPQEALIRGRYKLVTGLAETAIVNFKTNRQGLYYAPYDIILVVDEDMNSGISGRIKEITGPKTFSLRDPVYLEAGFNYKVMIQIPEVLNGKNFLVLEREIAPGTTGTFTEITTVTDLPDLPDQAVFTISTTDSSSAPRPYRITRIDEVDGDPDNVEIQAIEVNRLKWDFVDGETEEYEEVEHYDLNTGGRTQPVPALRIRAFNTLSGPRTVHNILLDWDPSPTKTTSNYKIYMSKDNGPQSLLGETGIYSFEWNDIAPGEYLFSVIAVSSVGGALAESQPVTIEHRFIGDFKDPERVTDLHMIDEAAPPIYARRSPSFDWSPVDTPKHRDYVVRIYDPTSGVVLAQHFTRETDFVYDYETNSADHAGVAARNFDIGVASRDQYGAVSAFNIISAENPPPAVTTPVINGGISSAVISWNTTGIVDYLGAKIWIGTTPDFPLNVLYLKYDGGGNNFTFIGTPDTPYYIRMALFDNFNQTEYVVSDAMMFTVQGVNVEDVDEVFRAPLGYISDDGGTGLAARLREIEREVSEVSLGAARNAVADWDQRESVKRTLSKQGARFEEEINILVTADEAISNRITDFEAEMDTDLTSTNARITTEETARATADTAIASTVSNLTGTVNTNNIAVNARVATEETARATADTAISTTVSNLNSTVNTNNTAVNARIGTEETARATADTALTTTLNTLSSTVTTNNNSINARVQTEETARSTADTGLANSISSVSTVANNAAAAVVTEQNARISADGALATSVTEVATNLGIYSASGRAAFQVAATPGGATARYSVVVRANTSVGYSESGLYLDIMSGGATRAAIKADSFYLLSSVGGYLAAPFYVSGGNVFISNAHITGLTADRISVSSLEALSANLGNVTVHGDLLVYGTVTTGKVAGNAITVSNGFVDNGRLDVSYGGIVRAATVGLSSTAGVNYIDFSCKSQSLTGAFPPNYYRLYRDGVLLVDKSFYVDDLEGERDVVIQYRDVVGDWYTTYYVDIQNNGDPCGHPNRFLRVLNMKR